MSNKEEITMEEVASDIQRALTRLIKINTQVDARAELVNNLYPLMLALLESVNSRFIETEELVSNLLEESETIIQPEDGSQFEETLNLGEQLLRAIKGVSLSDETLALVDAFKESLAKSRETLGEFTLELGETEETEEGDDE